MRNRQRGTGGAEQPLREVLLQKFHETPWVLCSGLVPTKVVVERPKRRSKPPSRQISNPIQFALCADWIVSCWISRRDQSAASTPRERERWHVAGPLKHVLRVRCQIAKDGAPKMGEREPSAKPLIFTGMRICCLTRLRSASSSPRWTKGPTKRVSVEVIVSSSGKVATCRNGEYGNNQSQITGSSLFD